MSDGFLSQEEIDALLKQKTDEDPVEDTGSSEDELDNDEEKDSYIEEEDDNDISTMEKDALGEIGNISMGSAATALSSILQQKVNITTPTIGLTTQEELFSSFEAPYVVIDVNFTEGLTGSNLFIIGNRDAYIIADLMMGGDGRTGEEEIQLTELHISAVAEAMNQMMGSAATSMSSLFSFPVMISPPLTEFHDFTKEKYESPLRDERIVVISFNLVVGDLVDSQLMQVTSLEIAKQQAKVLLDPSFFTQAAESEAEETTPVVDEAEVEAPDEPALDKPKEEMEPVEMVEPAGMAQAEEPRQMEDPIGAEDSAVLAGVGGAVEEEEPLKIITQQEQRNLDLILDIPLRVSVILGRTKKPIGNVLGLRPGTIVELDSLINEPVEILVNGILVAEGQVVVVNENFGVQIQNIVSPEERLRKLK
ncbi:MAG: flagellar motor switch phosphatase FliY [Clostridia bacterium]|nr:flagellar motor switch phosphatase FliY [Clostridia bacterium]